MKRDCSTCFRGKQKDCGWNVTSGPCRSPNFKYWTKNIFDFEFKQKDFLMSQDLNILVRMIREQRKEINSLGLCLIVLNLIYFLANYKAFHDLIVSIFPLFH
jgi:hypothetical protein